MKRRKPVVKTLSLSVEDYARMSFPEFLRNTTYADWISEFDQFFANFFEGISLLLKSLWGLVRFLALLVMAPVMKPIRGYETWQYLRETTNLEGKNDKH